MFKRKLARLELWRAVEAQHVISTMVLVDTAAEQRLLEDLIESSKPGAPDDTGDLHYLLFTPFRYPPFGRGSRFRGPVDPGVFYGAEAIRTACAELGYWRWRFVMDSPGLSELEPKAQTVFSVVVRGSAVDLRRAPFVRKRNDWTHRSDYGPCQRFAEEARRDQVAVIRYESVRDPEHGGAAAVLTPRAFARRKPLRQQTWYLRVTRDLVRWYLAEGRSGFEFTF